MSVSSPFLHLLLPFCSFFSLLIIFPFSLLGGTRVGSFPPPWGRARVRARGLGGYFLFFYLHLNSSTFLSSRYPSKWSSICTGPTPAGVPVKRMSPVLRVKYWLIYAMISSIL